MLSDYSFSVSQLCLQPKSISLSLFKSKQAKTKKANSKTEKKHAQRISKHIKKQTQI